MPKKPKQQDPMEEVTITLVLCGKLVGAANRIGLAMRNEVSAYERFCKHQNRVYNENDPMGWEMTVGDKKFEG